MPRLHAVFTTENNHGLSARVHDFRRALFIEALGWDLACDARGGERDQFDTDAAVHLALLEEEGGADRIVGSFRALRTDGPYLCRAVFPGLAAERAYPVAADAWEISRFGVAPGAGRRIALTTYALMFDFARRRRARALVALADLTYERFLAGLGVATERYGPPGIVGRDRQGRELWAVAGEIPLARQGGRRFEHLMQHVDGVEISDETSVETSVRGRGRLPARPAGLPARPWQRPGSGAPRAAAARP